MPEIEVESHDGIAVITLNAPERRNAITVEMSRELTAACDAIDSDPGIGAVVIRGRGPSFCAGADRSLLARVGEDPVESRRRADLLNVYQAFIGVGHLQAPTIAAVRGVAIGGGLNLVFATDLRVVADDAKLLAGFLKIGVHPGGGHFTLVGRTVGREAVTALTVFGESLTGRDAAARGLVWTSVPDERVDETAMSLA